MLGYVPQVHSKIPESDEARTLNQIRTGSSSVEGSQKEGICYGRLAQDMTLYFECPRKHLQYLDNSKAWSGKILEKEEHLTPMVQKTVAWFPRSVQMGSMMNSTCSGKVQNFGTCIFPSANVHPWDYTLWILRKKDDSGDLANSLLGGKGGLGVPKCKARAIQQLDGLEGWDVLRTAIDATSEDIISERKLMDRLPLDKWSDADGHVLLIGDAAHAQFVGPGQGARTAFEDAHQLSVFLEMASRSSFSEESIKDAVKRFEEVRIPRMKKMQQYASHSTRIPDFQPEWVQKLTLEERQKMGREYINWVHAYPHKQQGDPDSFYFK
eukprot:Gb_34594 [translate_table: standard]